MAINGQGPSKNSDNYLPNGQSSSAGIAPQQQYTASGSASSFRLSTIAEGIVEGGARALEAIAGSVFNFNFLNANGSSIDPIDDWRVRISMQPNTAALFYANPSNPLLYPLNQTAGVVFPYTPQIDIVHRANYGEQRLTHNNYNAYFYEGSAVQQINITAEFTVQNIEEGQYYMACVNFFRACTKMFYGNSNLAGTPPPMVFLDGYGATQLPHVPCIVTEFTQQMPADVDYIKVPVGASLNAISGNPIQTSNFAIPTRVPTSSSLRVNLQPVYSRNNISRNFTLERYAAGGLIQSGNGNRGGFL